MNGEYMAGRKAARTSLGDVLVLGLGKSGKAVVEYCLGLLGGRVSSLTIAAGEHNEAAVASAKDYERRGAKVYFDRYTFDEERYDLCIASPGISQFSRFYENAQAASACIVSEVEFAWRESRADTRWIAVTGTNGKTTTTTLITHILDEAGERVAAVGNIGNTCIEAVAADAADVFVAEVSSFQLASMELFAPQVAVLLNITPDHLYWHMTFDAYVEAKRNVYRRLSDTRGTLVIDGVCDVTRACIKDFKDDPDRAFDYIPIGCAQGVDASMKEACGSENAAWLHDGMLRVEYGGEAMELIAASSLRIKGAHNASNALAAASAALAAGVPVECVRRALRSFEPLEHRLEPCGIIDGVSFFNDSKATNVDATCKALSAFAPDTAVFLLGGHDKGTDLDALVADASRVCRAVVCFGAAGERFERAFAAVHDAVEVVRAAHMEDALDAAMALAHPGDSVVLSPACASFDEFDSFEHRGRVFKQLVAFRAQSAR
ncbi:MAG: UDP-N-acetylmuramoyl-L-alanine--D-glutamate ligase [Slackia sp.]|nr:UDP-N-acetylmuramoyl-L-alanine--D-glutamate ligase [Slackia sp.]